MHPVDGTISDRVLSHGEGLIVALPIKQATPIGFRSRSVPTVRAYFFKVVKARQFNWRYTQIGSFNQGGSQDFAYLGDTGLDSGEDVLRVENNDFYVYHIGIGLNSPNLRVYESVDPSNPSRSVQHSNGTEPDPTNGDQFDFYDGKMQADKFDPPEHTERLAIRNDKDGQFLQYGFYADQAVSTGESDLELVGRAYQLRPVLDADEQDFLLRQNRKRNAGETPLLKTITIQVGGMSNYEIGNSLPTVWGELSDDLARDLDYPAGDGRAGAPVDSGNGSRSGQQTQQAQQSRRSSRNALNSRR